MSKSYKAYITTIAATEEMSIKDASFSLWQNPMINNAICACSDGQPIEGNLEVMAYRSPYFLQVLTDKRRAKVTGAKRVMTNEVSKHHVPCPYDSTTMKHVLEYIHSNFSPLIVDPTPPDGWHETHAAFILQRLECLLLLNEAAVFYGLPLFSHAIQEQMMGLVHVMPLLSLLILEASNKEGPSVISRQLQEEAFSKIHLASLTTDALACIRVKTFACVLSNATVQGKAEEIHFFEAILMWKGANSNRFQEAKDLVKQYVDLMCISPSILSTLVVGSGLVTQAEVDNAFLQQSLRAEREGAFALDANAPLWKGNQDFIFTATTDWASDSMDCRPMRLGRRYTWTVGIEGYSTTEGNPMKPSVRLGVALVDTHGRTSMCSASGKELGVQEEHMEVTVALDLREEDFFRGSLSISINGKTPILVHEGARDLLMDGASHFVPEVSCRNGRVIIFSVDDLGTSSPTRNPVLPPPSISHDILYSRPSSPSSVTAPATTGTPPPPKIIRLCESYLFDPLPPSPRSTPGPTGTPLPPSRPSTPGPTGTPLPPSAGNTPPPPKRMVYAKVSTRGVTIPPFTRGIIDKDRLASDCRLPTRQVVKDSRQAPPASRRRVPWADDAEVGTAETLELRRKSMLQLKKQVAQRYGLPVLEETMSMQAQQDTRDDYDVCDYDYDGDGGRW